MSTLLDALIHSDASTPANDPNMQSASQRSNGQTRRRSSLRPSGPPSESNGHLSDAEGFPDDEVVGLRGTDRNRPRNPMDRDISRVMDEVGEKVAEEFERFLDQ